jgi:hypothetical protein
MKTIHDEVLAARIPHLKIFHLLEDKKFIRIIIIKD